MATLDEIIEKKSNGNSLITEDVESLASIILNCGRNNDKLVEFLSSLNLNNFSIDEAYEFSLALAKSGKLLHASEKLGECISKLSAGYISDGASLIVMSVLASLGEKVIKLSSSKIGMFSSTISKLNAFDGFSAGVSEHRFLKVAADVGCSILENKGEIVPADTKLIGLMKQFSDVSIPLLACSLAAKKIALGASTVVYDVKCGEGGLVESKTDAYKLAKLLVEITKKAGMKAACVVTTLYQPISASIGAVSELREVVKTLSSGDAYLNSDLISVAKEIVVIALILSGRASGRSEASEMFDESILSGKALSKFKEIVLAFGGNLEVLSVDSSIISGIATSYIVAEENGYLADIDAQGLYQGFSLMQTLDGETPDKNAGIVFLEREGTKLKTGERIARITYSFDNKNFAAAYKKINEAIIVHPQKPKREKLLVKVFI